MMYAIFQKLCEKNNVTPYRVSKETGVSRTTLSDWKNGKSTPKQDKMQKIADYFGVSLSYLTTGETPKEDSFETDASEREVIMLFRNATKANPKDKEMLLNQFKSTIDIYKKAKGIED